MRLKKKKMISSKTHENKTMIRLKMSLVLVLSLYLSKLGLGDYGKK